jgi:hypothetical protein
MKPAASISFDRAEGSVSVAIDGSCVFEKKPFPLIDLSRQLREWLQRAHDAENAPAFIFRSSSAPHLLGSFRIEPRRGGWQFTSAEEKKRHSRLLSFDEVRSMVAGFTNVLPNA